MGSTDFGTQFLSFDYNEPMSGDLPAISLWTLDIAVDSPASPASLRGYRGHLHTDILTLMSPWHQSSIVE